MTPSPTGGDHDAKRNHHRGLLNAVEHPEQLEKIPRTYSRSKGPYYAALLEATNQLQDQLDELLEEIFDANEQYRLILDVRP